MADTDDRTVFIWSIEHQAWWAANEQGYALHISGAGRYTVKQGTAIVVRANRQGTFNECLVPVTAIHHKDQAHEAYFR